MALPERLKFGIFHAPHHRLGDNPTLALERDLEMIQWLDTIGFDESWTGEHHSAGWETIASPEIFLATAAERTKHIRLGTGVISLPYHHPLMVANRMVLLDHLTRGRIMMGVGPGALVSDAYMLGINHNDQRHRMEESLGIILRLLTTQNPITHNSDWFTLNEALLHLRPYTQPHFPIACAAFTSPAGMVSAGKHGTWVLTFVRGGASNLRQFWNIAEEVAAKHGNIMQREEWRLVLHVYLAETKKEALIQARAGAADYVTQYQENTLGQEPVTDNPDKIIDTMVENGSWCVGTPDDLVAYINRLDEESGGFGGLLIQTTEWATRQQVLNSYELVARYVMPKFQGSLANLQSSQRWARTKRQELLDLRQQAVDKAKTDYEGQYGNRTNRA